MVHLNAKKPRVPRFPIMEYVGRYEAWLSSLYGVRSFDYNSEKLEQFMRNFPGFKGIEDFTSPDVIAYRDWQLKRGRNISSLAMELKVAKNFWRWLIEHQRLPVLNPCRGNDFKHLQKRHALLMEAEKSRSHLTDIEISTSDEGAAIQDCEDYLAIVGWVAKPEPGAEGEGLMGGDELAWIERLTTCG